MTSCIISSFYIKPQLCANSKSRALCCIISSFYIKPQLSPPLTAITTELYYIFILHQTTTMLKLQAEAISCIISSFYIKPQLLRLTIILMLSCIISSFYIKPQPKLGRCNRAIGCIISSFYIKPQPTAVNEDEGMVVLYLHSTSNHN